MSVFALLDHGAVSVLCLACGDEALACERSAEQYKQSEDNCDKALPMASSKHTNTETKASITS